MASKSYVEGIAVVGVLSGLVLAVGARSYYLRKKESGMRDAVGNGFAPEAAGGETGSDFRMHVAQTGLPELKLPELKLLRESPESGGIPMGQTMSGQTAASRKDPIDIRPGGAPGRIEEAEKLEIPGSGGQVRDLQGRDLADSSEPIRMARRAVLVPHPPVSRWA